MNLKLAEKIRKELKSKADKKVKESSKRFFKEPVKVYGVSSKNSTIIFKSILKEIKELSKDEILEICENLYQSGYCEEAWIAAALPYEKVDDFEERDFKTLERWIVKYVDDWAKCDTLCNHTVAKFIDKFPRYLKKLKEWTKSPLRYVKRASAVTLIVPAKEGRYLKDVFEIAETLLLDSDDLVQKGYGWLLKATSQSHQKEVFDYVMRHKKIMPRTALRYAIEKMPKDMKIKCMER